MKLKKNRGKVHFENTEKEPKNVKFTKKTASFVLEGGIFVWNETESSLIFLNYKLLSKLRPEILPILSQNGYILSNNKFGTRINLREQFHRTIEKKLNRKIVLQEEHYKIKFSEEEANAIDEESKKIAYLQESYRLKLISGKKRGPHCWGTNGIWGFDREAENPYREIILEEFLKITSKDLNKTSRIKEMQDKNLNLSFIKPVTAKNRNYPINGRYYKEIDLLDKNIYKILLNKGLIESKKYRYEKNPVTDFMNIIDEGISIFPLWTNTSMTKKFAGTEISYFPNQNRLSIYGNETEINSNPKTIKQFLNEIETIEKIISNYT